MADPTLAITLDTPSSVGAAGYLVIGDATFGKIGTAKVSATVNYTDFSSYARSLHIRRGMSSATGLMFTPEAGSCDIVFDNRTRTFDPDVNTDVTDGRPIQVAVTFNAVTYNLFTGTVDQWSADYPAFGHDQVVNAVANDGISLLAQINLSDAPPRETTGQRINRLANLVGWPPLLRSIDTGVTVMPAGQSSASALALLQKASDSEFGQLYVETDGTLTFRDRNTLVTAARSLTSQATFTDTYSEISAVPTSRTSVVNIVRVVYNQAGDYVEASDGTSIGKYGSRPAQPIQTEMVDPNSAANLARTLVLLNSTRITRFESVTLKPANSSTLWTQAFSRKIGDRITVTRTPLTGSPITKDCFIVGIEHQVDASLSIRSWQTKFTLMDASLWPTPMIVGTGQIGTGTVWW